MSPTPSVVGAWANLPRLPRAPPATHPRPCRNGAGIGSRLTMMTRPPRDEIKARFRALHRDGTFLMPNPYDLGSCRLLTSLGFEALATTSGGWAASLGRPDMTADRQELIAHVRAMCEATHLPMNVDAERCFPDSPGGVAATVELLADAGAAGCSIEDWNPATKEIDDVVSATER